MQKRSGKQVLLNEAKRHRIGPVCNFRSCSNGAVTGFGIACIQPCPELFIQFRQRLNVVQRSFGNKLVKRSVETFLLSFALRIAWARVKQLDPQQLAGAFHPMRSVLGTVVEIDSLRNAIFRNGFAQRIFDNAFRHIGVEFTVNYHTSGIIQQTGKVRGDSKFVNRQRRTVLNVSLPQIIAMQPLKSLRAICRISVDLHLAGRIARTLERVL